LRRVVSHEQPAIQVGDTVREGAIGGLEAQASAGKLLVDRRAAER